MQFLKCFDCCNVPSENNDIHSLDLSNCDLSDVPQNVLLYERTLETLLLNSNHIYDLPLPLFHCQSLQVLSISNNDLRTLPAAIGYLVNLKELDISRNSVTEISESIKKCKKLGVVNASFNPLHHLPAAFTQLISLAELYLNDTALEYLPANIGRLSKLVILELRSNKLCGLPKSMSRLVNLARLDIGQNHFFEFPSVIGTLTAIKELWCDLNEFNVVPSFIGQLGELVHFEIGDNHIQSITNDIDGCKNLVDFSACYCDIQFVPHTIGLLKNLSCLKLDYNNLSSLTEAIGGLRNLEELSLSHNKLKCLPSSIGLLRKLVSLHLDSNKLKKLPAELGSCVSLTVLSLRNNELESVPAELGNLVNLSVVVLADNKLPYLPISILKLKKLNAVWLSHNQSKPLIPLQVDYNALHNIRVLTCYLLPQQKGNEERACEAASLEEGTNSLKKSQKIRFMLSSPNEKVGSLTRAPTPYPKKLRSLSKVAQSVNQSKSWENVESVNVENNSHTHNEYESELVDDIHQFNEITNQTTNLSIPHSNSSHLSNHTVSPVNQTPDSFIKTAIVKKQDHLQMSVNVQQDETDSYTYNDSVVCTDSNTGYSSNSEKLRESQNKTSIAQYQTSGENDRNQLRPPPYHIAATFSKKASLFNPTSFNTQNSNLFSKDKSCNDNLATNASYFSEDCRESICSEASSMPSNTNFNVSPEYQHVEENTSSNYHQSLKRNGRLKNNSEFKGIQNISKVASKKVNSSSNELKNNLNLKNLTNTNSLNRQFPVIDSAVFKASPYIPHSDESDDNSVIAMSKKEEGKIYSDKQSVDNYHYYKNPVIDSVKSSKSEAIKSYGSNQSSPKYNAPHAPHAPQLINANSVSAAEELKTYNDEQPINNHFHSQNSAHRSNFKSERLEYHDDNGSILSYPQNSASDYFMEGLPPVNNRQNSHGFCSQKSASIIPNSPLDNVKSYNDNHSNCSLSQISVCDSREGLPSYNDDPKSYGYYPSQSSVGNIPHSFTKNLMSYNDNHSASHSYYASQNSYDNLTNSTPKDEKLFISRSYYPQQNSVHKKENFEELGQSSSFTKHNDHVLSAHSGYHDNEV